MVSPDPEPPRYVVKSPPANLFCTADPGPRQSQLGNTSARSAGLLVRGTVRQRGIPCSGCFSHAQAALLSFFSSTAAGQRQGRPPCSELHTVIIDPGLVLALKQLMPATRGEGTSPGVYHI